MSVADPRKTHSTLELLESPPVPHIIIHLTHFTHLAYASPPAPILRPHTRLRLLRWPPRRVEGTRVPRGPRQLPCMVIVGSMRPQFLGCSRHRVLRGTLRRPSHLSYPTRPTVTPHPSLTRGEDLLTSSSSANAPLVARLLLHLVYSTLSSSFAA